MQELELIAVTEAVVLDITMNIVKEEGNTTEVVAEDIQPVAPIKITLPVPDNMKAGFKLYHYEDGATEPEEIPGNLHSRRLCTCDKGNSCKHHFYFKG